MINISTSTGEMNGVTVKTTQDRGFTPEELSYDCTDKILSVSDYSDPIVKEQAKAFKERIRRVVEFYLREAIKSDRTTVYNEIIRAGQPQLAELIRRL